MRNRNISEMVFILGLSLAFLAFSATAQTSSPQTTPSDQAPQATSPEQPQTEPSQQSPTATPAPEPQQPQNSPSQSAPSSPSTASPSQSTPPSQGSPSASGQQGNQASSIDDELQLTPDQKQKIAAVVDDENRQIGAVRDDNSMSMQQKQQKVMQIRQAGTPKIKAILTPDQLQKLAAIQQRMRDQQTGNQGASQPQPQQPQH